MTVSQGSQGGPMFDVSSVLQRTSYPNRYRMGPTPVRIKPCLTARYELYVNPSFQRVTLLESARQDAIGEATRAYSQAQADIVNDDVDVGKQQYFSAHRWITLVKWRNAALVFKAGPPLYPSWITGTSS
jgi:hypothetical protein